MKASETTLLFNGSPRSRAGIGISEPSQAIAIAWVSRRIKRIQRSGIGSRVPASRSESVSVMRASGGVRLNLQPDPAQDGGDALAIFVSSLVRDCATGSVSFIHDALCALQV